VHRKDSRGRDVATRDPGWTVSSSDTETLDIVFTTPADGHFAAVCDIKGASARVAPVGSLRGFGMGLAATALLGLAAVSVGIVWLLRLVQPASPSTVWSRPDPDR